MAQHHRDLLRQDDEEDAAGHLRGIRVASWEDLKQRIEVYLEQLNEHPVVFRWKHDLEALNVSQG